MPIIGITRQKVTNFPGKVYNYAKILQAKYGYLCLKMVFLPTGGWFSLQNFNMGPVRFHKVELDAQLND